MGEDRGVETPYEEMASSYDAHARNSAYNAHYDRPAVLRVARQRSQSSRARRRCSASDATGTIGGFCFLAWASADRLWFDGRRLSAA